VKAGAEVTLRAGRRVGDEAVAIVFPTLHAGVREPAAQSSETPKNVLVTNCSMDNMRQQAKYRRSL